MQRSNEEMTTCPYDVTHVILKHRMPVHLIKCRRQNVGKNFATCPFNSTHDVPARELKSHTENCPDRRKLDSYVYAVDDSTDSGTVESCHIELPPCNENWDEEQVDTASYLDIKNNLFEKKALFRVPVGMTKSMKKAFHQQEERRFEKLLHENSNE